MAVVTAIQLRRGTAASWTSANPTLSAGEPGVETDTGLIKIGNGTTAWNSLPYQSPLAPVQFNAQTANYTAVASDTAKVITMSVAGANTFSIPTNASVPFAIGTQITVIQIGAGQTTIQAVSSGTTTIVSNGATAAQPRTRVQYSSATCIKSGTDSWYVIGDIS